MFKKINKIQLKTESRQPLARRNVTKSGSEIWGEVRAKVIFRSKEDRERASSSPPLCKGGTITLPGASLSKVSMDASSLHPATSLRRG